MIACSEAIQLLFVLFRCRSRESAARAISRGRARARSGRESEGREFSYHSKYRNQARGTLQIPGAAEVIDADSYKRGRASTIRDALDFAPGAFVQSRFGAEEARLSIRGSGIQRTFHGRGIMLLQDDVPLNLADGSFDFQAIEPLATRYIEVYRGASSLQFCSTNHGGAINFVSFTGYDASPLTARLEYGSFQSFRAQLMLGSGDWPLRLLHQSDHGLHRRIPGTQQASQLPHFFQRRL